MCWHCGDVDPDLFGSFGAAFGQRRFVGFGVGLMWRGLREMGGFIAWFIWRGDTWGIVVYLAWGWRGL